MTIDEKVDQLVRVLTSESVIHNSDKPVAVVGKIGARAQLLFKKESDRDFDEIVQRTYIRHLLDEGRDYNQARQSWVAASGGDFEGYVRNHINDVLNGKGIVAVKGDHLKKLARDSQRCESLVAFLTLPAKRRCTQTSVDVWADNDVLVLALTGNRSWRILASISAKTSSHSRNTSVLFWSLAVRDLGIRYFLATRDRDGIFTTTCDSGKVKQERKLFEAYCDRVFTSNPEAEWTSAYCSQVKSLILRPDGTSELTDELLDLRLREVRDAHQGSTSLAELENW